MWFETQCTTICVLVVDSDFQLYKQSNTVWLYNCDECVFHLIKLSHANDAIILISNNKRDAIFYLYSSVISPYKSCYFHSGQFNSGCIVVWEQTKAGLLCRNGCNVTRLRYSAFWMQYNKNGFVVWIILQKNLKKK